MLFLDATLYGHVEHCFVSQRGKLSYNLEKEQEIKMHTAHHLDVLQKEFNVVNLMKTLWTILMRHILLSVRDSMTIVVRISRGR